MSAPQKKSHRHRFRAALICFGAAVLVFVSERLPVIGTMMLKLDRIASDAILAHGKLVKPREDVVFLGIDDSSLSLSGVWEEELAESKVLQKMKENFPWSREVHAEAVRKVLDAGARVVMIDLVFSAASLDPDGDAALAFALEDYPGRVVIASTFSDQNGSTAYNKPAPEILDSDDPADLRIGYASFWPDPVDDVVRQTVIRTTVGELNNGVASPGEPVFYSLAANTIRQMGQGPMLPATNEPLTLRFCQPGPDRVTPYRVHPIYEIFVPSHWENTYQNGAFFKNKIVCIGPAASVFQDFKPTPLGEMLGPQLQLTALTCLLDPDGIIKNRWEEKRLLMFLGAALFAWVATVWPKQIGMSLIVLGLGAVAYVQAGRVAFNLGQLVPLVGVIMVQGLGGGGVLIKQFLESSREKKRLQGMLSRMVSRNVAEAIIENKDSFYATLGGVRRPVTVLFSDVRGFTSMTEDSDPVAVVQQLNEYLERMVDAVFAENGTLDKFIGDAVMAVWGNLGVRTPEEEACSAIRSALTMLSALDTLNEGWKARGIAPFAIGIGLHHGDAIVGNIGSDEKMEPTVIGDTVNLASRLESLTKYYQCTLLLSGETAAMAGDTIPLRTLDRVRVKGKRTPVALFTGIDAKTAKIWPSMEPSWTEILRLYNIGEFSAAAAALDAFLAEWPNDGPAKVLHERCLHFQSNPPADWDGVYTLESK